MSNDCTISWEQFRPLLNKKGNGLSDQLLAAVEKHSGLKSFTIKKGCFLDLFVNQFTDELYNETKELYPTLY
jgi:hypothetical protein